MAGGNLDNQELVLLVVAIAARTVTQKVKIQSFDPLQIIPNLGGPLKLSGVGISDPDGTRIFKDALLTLAPDPAKPKVQQLNIAEDDKFSDLRSTLELVFFAAAATQPAGGSGGQNQ